MTSSVLPAANFVTAEWLYAQRHNPDLQLLDARLFPPGSQHGADALARQYRAGHLPGALLFDIDALSCADSPLPHTLPDADTLARQFTALGLRADRHLVIYDAGDLFSAPRAWWMLALSGARRISLLQGGFAAWRQHGYPLETGQPSVPAGAFPPQRLPVVIRDHRALRDLQAQQPALQYVDARAAERFSGHTPEPRPGVRSGHIPGSLNVPWQSVVENGALKDPVALRAVFQQAGVQLDKPIVVTCGSGVTAAVLFLALTQLGVASLYLYDGSWSDWGSQTDLPVATGL